MHILHCSTRLTISAGGLVNTDSKWQRELEVLPTNKEKRKEKKGP